MVSCTLNLPKKDFLAVYKIKIKNYNETYSKNLGGWRQSNIMGICIKVPSMWKE